MSRLEWVIAQSGGAAEIVGPADAWRAAEIVTDRFGHTGEARTVRRVRLVANYVRLRSLAPSVVNRDRTAVIGVGGVRPVPLVAAALLGGWLAPRLPAWMRLGIVVAVSAVALEHNRLRRTVWVYRALRLHAPDALLAGEFASIEPGAGIAFAAELVEVLGRHTAMAATVQGPLGDRRSRAQVRLYERRLGFTVVDRRVIAGDEILLLTRARVVDAPERVPVSAGEVSAG